MIMRLSFLLAALCSFVICEDLAAICGVSEAQLSCGQCIKQHPDCAWCRDPHALSGQRCQPKKDFTADTCNPDYVYSPTTEMKIAPHNLRLEAVQGDGRTIVQLEPQQVVLRMKPGDEMTVPFKYIHRGSDIKEFFIQTSEFHQTKGVQLKFFVMCDGKEVEGKTCPNMQEGQRYDFKIQVTLEKCSNEGDVSISVGVYGYRTVSALYITPLCGCECEKLQQQEKNSPLCHKHGNLICGQCVCDSTRGGDRCECPLATYGVKNALELEDKCRQTSSSPICGGMGSCKCGQCQCNSASTSGKFCECDHASCPTSAGSQSPCSGNGVCDCGKCKCEEGWEREDCSCTTAKTSCIESGVECTNNGHCECGKCVCNDGFTGAFCGAVDEMTTPDLRHDTEGENEQTNTEQGEEEQSYSDSEESSDGETDSEEAGETQEQTAAATFLTYTIASSFVVLRFL